MLVSDRDCITCSTLSTVFDLELDISSLLGDSNDTTTVDPETER